MSRLLHGSLSSSVIRAMVDDGVFERASSDETPISIVRRVTLALNARLARLAPGLECCLDALPGATAGHLVFADTRSTAAVEARFSRHLVWLGTKPIWVNRPEGVRLLVEALANLVGERLGTCSA